MTDRHPRIKVTKPVDLARLAEEVGGDLAAAHADDGTITEVVALTPGVTRAALTAAVNKHDAPPVVQVDPLSDAEITRLRALLAAKPEAGT